MSTKLCFYLVYLLSQKKIRITVQTQQLHRWANERKQVCLMKRYFRESVIIMQMLHFPDSFVWRETALLPLSMLSKFSWCVGPLGLRSVFPLSSILLWGTDNKSDPLPGPEEDKASVHAQYTSVQAYLWEDDYLTEQPMPFKSQRWPRQAWQHPEQE